jgi:hypothetical protein
MLMLSQEGAAVTTATAPRLQMCRNPVSRLRAASGAIIVIVACCAGCGTTIATTNNCSSNAKSSTDCSIGSDSNPTSRAGMPTRSPAAVSLSGGSPSGAAPSASPASTQGQPPSAVPLIVPIISQPGWNLVWSGQTSIGPQGIIFSQVNPTTGPETGTGGEFDLQYIASGGGSGWGSNLNYLYYWTNNYRPGPAIIAGILDNDNFSGENPAGMLAHVGNRLFAAMDTEAEGFNIAFYMQVIAVGEESVLVKLWIWNSA